MTMTDPIADMLTRIRNANTVKHETVDVPASNIKKEIVRILLEEGFVRGYDVIEDEKQGIIRIQLKYGQSGERVIQGIKRISKVRGYDVIEDEKQGIIRIQLKYGQSGERVIQGIKRISKPGMRVYTNAYEVPKVLNGLGISIISTSKGILTDKQARKENVGGEVICYVW